MAPEKQQPCACYAVYHNLPCLLYTSFFRHFPPLSTSQVIFYTTDNFRCDLSRNIYRTITRMIIFPIKRTEHLRGNPVIILRYRIAPERMLRTCLLYTSGMPEFITHKVQISSIDGRGSKQTNHLMQCDAAMPVSYTHLDVYKRQPLFRTVDRKTF